MGIRLSLIGIRLEIHFADVMLGMKNFESEFYIKQVEETTLSNYILNI